MSLIPPDEDGQGDGGDSTDEQMGNAPTMLYMKPVADEEAAKEAAEKAEEMADDMGGETLLMMPAVPGETSADEAAPPAQGPIAGPLPEDDGLAELDSAKTMMYMPAVDGADASDVESTSPGGFSDEVQKKLAELKDSLGDEGADAGSSTVAYMPAVGELPMDQAMERMLAETGEGAIPVQEPAPSEEPRTTTTTAPAFPAVSPTPAPAPAPAPAAAPAPKVSPAPAVKPGPDLDDDDDDNLAALTGKKKGGKIFLILFILILLGAGGVFGAMLFDWMARPEFLDSLPHYELNF